VPELLGYARVSTTEENADLQRDPLTGAGCWKVFTDHVTGTRERARSSTGCSSRSARATRWWCGAWTGWVARCGT